MGKKETIADTLLGIAYQVGAPVVDRPKVTRRTTTENNGRKQETTEQFRKYSVVGGAIRTFISSLLVRKAVGIYKGPSQSTSRTRNGNPSDNSPADPYFDGVNHYQRIRRQLNSGEQDGT